MCVAIMLRTMYVHGITHIQRGAEATGAARSFAPVAAATDSGTLRRGERIVIAIGAQNLSTGVREYQHRAAAAQCTAGLRHHRVTRFEQLMVAHTTA